MGGGCGQRMASPSWMLRSEPTVATQAWTPAPECLQRGPQYAQKSKKRLHQVFGWNSVPADIMSMHVHVLRKKIDVPVEMPTCNRAGKLE